MTPGVAKSLTRSGNSNIQTVEAKLQQQGFSGFSAIQKLKCKIQSICSLDFTGPPVSRGIAVFQENALQQIGVWPHDVKAAAEAVRLKYGPALPPTSNGIFALMEQKWRSPTGETMEIAGDSVWYTSGSQIPKQDNSKF